MKRIPAIILLITSVSLLALAQTRNNKRNTNKEIDSMLIAKEKEKWEAMRTGQRASVIDLFADNFISIGYSPGGVRMTTKADMISGQNRLPSAEFELSDFKVITANRDSAVVTYRARGTVKTPPGPNFKIFATSVWVKRSKEWKTIFYQATRTE